jgi:hypothetical protein
MPRHDADVTIDETFDVGVDTHTSVKDKDYQVPFRFTGKVDRCVLRSSTAWRHPSRTNCLSVV